MEERTKTNTHLLELLLRPIIRFCLRRSLRFQEFMEVTRHLYVRCSQESFDLEGHESNVSRIALATGLQRREVTRLLKEKDVITPEPNLLHKVIGQWEGDSRFKEKNGKPKKLTFKGVESEFAELVRSVSQDLNIYTVLFELERLKIIQKEGSRLILTDDAVNPGTDTNRGIELLSNDINDLISAVEENLFTNVAVPNHHIKTQYDNVVVEALPKIRAWLLDHGAKFHKEARAYLAKFDKDLQPKLGKKKGSARVALGSYSVTSELTKEKE